MTPTSVTYEWTWAADDPTGPRGRAVNAGFAIDTTPVAITELTVTTFPGTDEEPLIAAKGRILTKAGAVDRRHTYSQGCWQDPHLTALAMALLAEAQGQANGVYLAQTLHGPVVL